MFALRLGILRGLHEEHAAILAVLERLESLLAVNGPQDPPDTTQAGIAGLLDDVAAALGDDVGHHYAFEETHLFPRFAEFADPGISEMLRREHEIIRPLAERLVAIITEAKVEGFSAALWAEFHKTGGEVVEREAFHIQKEEMGFLPALDQMLDEEDDGHLQMIYMEMKGG
jgi:hemerythrin-like domain-containing protein